MSQTPRKQSVLRVSDLSIKRPVAFDLAPDKAEMALIAKELDLSALRKLRFRGTLTAEGRSDWLLLADLGATVVQPCVVTLDPVTSRIDEKITRRFLAELQEPEVAPGDEVEMPEDDTIEPLGNEIDLNRVMIEALALSLPDYPRSDGAELGQITVAEDGITPLEDEDTKPFAGLAALRDKMENDE
ncbi:Uncharacterized metal-binding protein YceD, DUF177 family [Roseovarius lutimaris]|uniref:Uncharacterized metal-binding protein YceD, DUF177 family n=1 Tax=Roseovarius lutimaris TaxID=1005928 RepID=A0A1I5BPD9_9RHOB|nr:DUF177 domain-containing protein [Roseovarius lutimaris]SFN76644.1 Uncharacterized metal-binding protein YceD, DUF177 family [Roseovarius lutimaris]